MKKAERIFDRVIDTIELALNLIIMGVIGAQIITRTFFNAPLKFPEEVAVFAMIAMIFGGICMVEKLSLIHISADCWHGVFLFGRGHGDAAHR